MSLPPHVRWGYGWEPEPGTPEAEARAFFHPQDWLGSRGKRGSEELWGNPLGMCWKVCD